MKTVVSVLTAMLLVFVGLVVLAQAEVAGRMTQVEGTVDFLKGGKLPAVAAKLNDSVEVGDVMRTKSLSKAQITFMDNTVITVSPESRIAIEEYMFDPGKGKRNAVLQLFQGLAHVVVSKLFKVSEPDFVVKTHTAVMGVRGTDVGLRLSPNSTTILTFEGHTEVGNIFPEVGDLLFKKAYKTAWGGASTVHLHNMQGTTVFMGLPPTQTFTVDQGMKDQFISQTNAAATGQHGKKDGTTAGGGTSGTGGGTGSSSNSSLTSSSLSGTDTVLGGGDTPATLPGQIIAPNPTPIPPTPPPNPVPPPVPPPSTSNFSETLSGQFSLTSTSPYTIGNFTSTGPVAVTRTGVNPGSFTASLNFSASGITWNPSYNGTFTGTINGSTIASTLDVSLNSGGSTWTGTAIPFSVNSDGILNFSLTSLTGVTVPGNTPLTVTAGSFAQTTSTPPPPTPSTYSFTQTGYSAWQSTAATNGLSNTVTLTGWGQRTGTETPGSLPLPDSYGGYFTSSSTGSRTLTTGSLLGNGTGTSFSTLTGTVTGVPGSTLTGTGTATGTSSYGETFTFTGTVSIDATGRLTFTYNNGTISSLGRLLSASGTNIDTPGTFFTQSMGGATLGSSSSPYTTSSSTSAGAGGSRSGVVPGDFGLSLTGTETSPWSFSYLPTSTGDLNATMQGVVSGTSGSTLTGAMTIFPNRQDAPFASSLLSTLQPNAFLFPLSWNNETIVSSISIQPNGTATGTVYDTYFQNGSFIPATFNVTQTPITAGVYTPTSVTYDFTQTYNGALMFNNNTVGVAASDISTNGSGWGYRDGTGTTGGVTGGAVLNYNGYFAAYDNGVWNKDTITGNPVTSYLPANYNGSSLATGISGPGSVTQMSGSVAGNLGQPLTGNMTWIGSLLNGPSFVYHGPVTIYSDGSLQFNYGNGTYANGGGSYTSNWTFGTGASGTASGMLNEYPGYKFTQTMTGDNIQVNLTGSSNGTLTVSNSTLSNSLTTPLNRSGVYGGNIGPFSGTFNLWSGGSGSLPSVFPQISDGGGTSVTLKLDGVVGTSTLGATNGPSTLQISATEFPDLSLTVPGYVALSPGGTYFTSPGVLIQNNFTGTPFAVGSYNGSQTTLSIPLAQTPVGLPVGSLYYFTESYQGFRLSTLGASPNLANIEGYGYGSTGTSLGLVPAGTIPASATALPTNSVSGYNYLGAFVAQDLGTRASATSLSSNMASLSGTLAATLSGTLGKTLTGQGLFTGTNSVGVAFTYQGNVTLTATGQLVFNYYGNWNSTTSTQTGTGSGTIQQIPGTPFTETVTGTYQAATTSTPLGTNYPTGTNLTVNTFNNTAALNGTRILNPGPNQTSTSTTGSIAGMLAFNTTNPPPSGSDTGTGSVTLQGVVAATSPQSQWGVATSTSTYTPSGGSPSALPGTTGVVTIDPSGTLTGQFVNTVNGTVNGTSTPASLTQNYASVTNSSGLTTASYTQTASGTFNSTASNINNNTQTVANITAPALTGTSTGVLAGPINANLAITSTALQPDAYGLGSGSGTIATTAAGVVAGPSGGTKTGVSTVTAVKTTGSNTITTYVGTTTLTPTALTTILQGVNPATPGGALVGATQTGTMTVTK